MVARHIGFAGVFIAAALCAAPSAFAGEGKPASAPSAAELASARRLFSQALAAEDKERWAEALEIYRRVSEIALSPSLQYHMAVCHEGLGQLVEAINAYELAAAAAEARREIALAKESQARLEKVRGRIAHITIAVPEDAQEVQIEVDGQPINPALAGTAVLINPGDRRVVVRARNYGKVFDTTVHAQAGALAQVPVDLGAKKAPPGPRRAQAPQRPAPEPPPEPSLAPGFIAGGTALALAAGAIATGVAAYDVRETYLEQNASPAPGSLAERESLRDRGQALAITSTALTGGAILAAGVATYFFWPSSSPPAGKPSASVSPWVAPDGAGLGIRGAL